MPKNYSLHVIELREKFASEGLSRAFREAFSALPAGFGHLLDTLLRLDGLILKDRENFLSGPLGFALGFPFVIFGAVVGKLAAIILNIPSYLGYYVLDRSINYFSPAFDKIMELREGADEPNITIKILNLITIIFTSLTQTPPKEMDGFFGFFAGFIPQSINYIIQRASAIFTALVHYPITNICSIICDFYGTTPSENKNRGSASKKRKGFIGWMINSLMYLSS